MLQPEGEKHLTQQVTFFLKVLWCSARQGGHPAEHVGEVSIFVCLFSEMMKIYLQKGQTVKLTLAMTLKKN